MNKKILSLLTLVAGVTLVACGRPMDSQSHSVTDTTSVESRDAKSITLDKAKQVAFADAGVTESEVINLLVEEDVDLANRSFEISFDANGKEYTYTIDQVTGSILEKEVEQSEAMPTSSVEAQKAKEAALADANLSETAVTHLHVTQDTDDLSVVFEVNFVHDGMSYHYVIDANTTAVLEKEVEPFGD